MQPLPKRIARAPRDIRMGVSFSCGTSVGSAQFATSVQSFQAQAGLAFVSTACVISPTTFASQGIGVDVKCGKRRWFLLTAHWSHKEEHEREQHSRSFVPQRYQWVHTHGASRWHPAREKTDQQEQHNNGEERQRIVGRNSPELVGQYSGDRKACG